MRVWIFASGSRIARIVLQSWVLMASRSGQVAEGYVTAMACSRQCRNRTIARQSFPLPSSVRTLLESFRATLKVRIGNDGKSR